MEAWSLASGSSGNAYLLKSGETYILVDCGLSAKRLQQALATLRVNPRHLCALFLTHAHSDHLGSARLLSDTYGIPVMSTAGTLGHDGLRDARYARAIEPGNSTRVGEMEVRAFRVPHDCIDPVGYRFTAGDGEVTVVTDLGHVPDAVLPMLSNVRLLVMESNHDPEMLVNGPYHARLKRRVSGERGHLSNAATARAILGCQARPPEVVWLAHLSAVNNRPALAQTVVSRSLAAAGLGHVRVEVAARSRPSLHWSSTPPPVQLPLL
jgi:phosphoribosyl 1,2-cyclic phosphodiesterase